MSASLRLISLGGYGEIGKNMTLLDCEGQLLLIDAGIAFPDEENQLGIDLLIPNFSYLREHADRLVGIMLTHGHEDHIGGLPFLLREIQAPLYGTPLTMGLLRAKLGQHRVEGMDLNVVRAGDRVQIGVFDIECIRVNHSIPDCLGLGIRTPAGIVVHSGDFKFDHTPIDGEVTDFSALARLGDEGVKLLISDSTNIERAGHTPSEAVVGQALERIFPTATGRILIATFASQIHRIQQIFDVAAAQGRKVLVAGRSMEKNVHVARDLGYLSFPDQVRTNFGEVQHLRDEEVVVLITGSQGEPVSGLSRLAQGSHPKLRLHPNDTVILSATPIPGNEATVWRLIDALMRGGANVVDHREDIVHVSGHASREEIALLFNLVRPEYGVPFHGEYRHMIAYGNLAQQVGLSHEKIFLLQNGDVLRLDDDGATLEAPIEHGVWTIDGNRINELGVTDAVFQDRTFLAESGVISASIGWDFARGEAAGPPVVKVRGVRIPDDRGDGLLAAAAEAVTRRLGELDEPARRQRAELERAGKRALRSFFEKRTGTFPVMQFLLLGLNESDPTDPEPADEPHRGRAVLTVDGEVQQALALTLEDLAKLSSPEQNETDSAELTVAALLRSAGVHQQATHLTIANETEGVFASLALAELRSRGCLIYGQGDQPLAAEDGGPIRFRSGGCDNGGEAVVSGVNRLTATIGPGRTSPARR